MKASDCKFRLNLKPLLATTKWLGCREKIALAFLGMRRKMRFAQLRMLNSQRFRMFPLILSIGMVIAQLIVSRKATDSRGVSV